MIQLQLDTETEVLLHETHDRERHRDSEATVREALMLYNELKNPEEMLADVEPISPGVRH